MTNFVPVQFQLSGTLASVSDALATTTLATSTAPSPQSLRIEKVVLPQLEKILPPGMILSEKKDIESEQLLTKIQNSLVGLSKKYPKFGSETANGSIGRLQKLSSPGIVFSGPAKESAKATLEILEELTTETYTDEGASVYGEWACNLLYNHLMGGALIQQERVDAIYRRVMQEKSTLNCRARSDEESNNPSFLFTDAKTKEPLALLKKANNQYESSHCRVIREWPLFQVQTRELVGYESSALLGFDLTPPTMKVDCGDKPGVLQEFIPEATTIYDLLDKKDGAGGLFLRSIDPARVHLINLSGILLGLGAGHMDNYLFTARKIQHIDLKESLIPYNRMPREFHVMRSQLKREAAQGKEPIMYCEDLDKKAEMVQKEMDAEVNGALRLEKRKEFDDIKKRLETERKAIITCRLATLGLPQSAKPLDRAALMLVRHPALPVLMDAHHASIRKLEIQPEALTAQRDRLDTLRELAKVELKGTIHATPRDFYFTIFGGRDLYSQAEKKNYSPLVIFNSIVGTAYRSKLKDLSNWDTLPELPSKPASESVTAKNLQALYASAKE
jgi:hypothetical protein